MTMQNAEALESLRWKKFPVLDDGFVCLADERGRERKEFEAKLTRLGFTV